LLAPLLSRLAQALFAAVTNHALSAKGTLLPGIPARIRMRLRGLLCRMSVVRTYCGHGIGDLFHCAPNVPHYAKNKAKGTMKVGEVFTIGACSACLAFPAPATGARTGWNNSPVLWHTRAKSLLDLLSFQPPLHIAVATLPLMQSL